jgi:hypothetical protein
MLLRPSPTDLWQLALDDARPCEDKDVELFLFDDAGSRFPPRAMTVEPGLCAWEVAGDEFPFLPEDVERSMRTREGWQILIFVDAEAHVLLAIMRHELEHVLQHRQNPNLPLTAWALGQGLETSVDPSSLGFRALYAAIATERAADAAGRQLALRCLGPAPEQLRDGPHKTLLFEPTPGPPASELPIRMIGELALMPTIAARGAIGNLFDVDVTAADALESLADYLVEGSGPALYDALNRDSRITRLREDLASQIDHAKPADAEEARRVFRGVVVRGEEVAVELGKVVL